MKEQFSSYMYKIDNGLSATQFPYYWSINMQDRYKKDSAD